MPDHKARGARNEATRTFGQRVRDRRLQLGFSQELAAQRCGIHWTQLGKIERGQRSLRLETILKIASGLELHAGELIDGLPLPSEREVADGSTAQGFTGIADSI